MKRFFITFAIFVASVSASATETVTCKFNGENIRLFIDNGQVTYKIGRGGIQQGVGVIGLRDYANPAEVDEMLEMNGINPSEIADYKEIIMKKTVETSSVLVLTKTNGSVQNYLRGGGMVVGCE